MALFRNGRGWNVMPGAKDSPELEKLMYVDGYSDGVAATRSTLIKRCQAGARQSVNLPTRDVVKALNMFYEDPTNLKIPVGLAMTWLSDKTAGRSALHLDGMLADFRRWSNTD